MSKEAKIMAAVFTVIFVGLGFLIARNNRIATTPIPKDRLITATSHSRGNPDAKVNIVEFGDFQCPACAAAYPIMEQLLAMYKDNPQVNFVARNFPLPSHRNAVISAQAAEAAGAQGKYWEMYGMLYERQGQWAESADPLSVFVQYAAELKLDTDRFRNEIQEEKYKGIVIQDQQAGLALGVNSTPTFFLNGIRAEGIQSISDFKSRIDAELAR